VSGGLRITEISAELEDAGLLGLSASSFLALFALAGGNPGTFNTTRRGLVWTKSLQTTAEHKIPLGVGTLNVHGARFTCTAGFRFDEKSFTHIDLLFRFFQGDGAPSPLAIEFKEGIAVLADAVKVDEQLVGYKNWDQPAILPLPIVSSLEFSFRRSPERGILSSAQIYDGLGGMAGAATGLLNLSLDDKILVLPWFFNVGLTVKDFFLDLSANEATDIAKLFPEVYDPSWKGIGAKSVGIFVPIDRDEGQFVAAELEGFLYGFDGRFSARGEIAYTDTDSEHLIKQIQGAIDIRNNEPIRSELAVTMDLRSAAERTHAHTKGASTGSLNLTQQDLVNKCRAGTDEARDRPAFDLSGQLRCRAQLLHLEETNDRTLWGFDLSVEGIDGAGSSGGLVLSGTAARAAFWLGLGGGGTYLLVDGIDQDDGWKVAGGFGLLFLLAADVGDFIDTNGHLLPTLEQLTIKRLGYRFVSIPQDSGGTKTLHQILIDVGLRMTFDGLLVDLLEGLIGRGLSTLHSPAKLFSKDVHEIEIKGPLELDILNLPLAFEKTASNTEFVTEIDERVRRLAAHQDLRLKAKKLPVIDLKEPTSSGPSKFPKPLMGVEFILKDDGGDTRFGVALRIKGVEHPTFTAATPVMGLVIYFMPEFKVEFETQLMVEPRFRFLVPPWVMADGALEIDKPIPAFDGTQNRIAVDVGVISTKVPKGGVNKDTLDELYDIRHYKYQFGGEVAWGEANASHPDPTQRFDFLFVEVHYDGSSPIFAIGPVGVYGLGGLFGRNIAPGFPGNQRDALAIARWIEADGQSFKHILDWPSSPSNDRWHPARDLDADKDLFVGGLRVRAGSLDGAETVNVESILMIGFQEFWIALGGHAEIKPIGAELVVVIVYDHPSKSFVLRAVFEFKIDKDSGTIITVKGPFEVGTVPGASWVVLGHYAADRGGPLVANLLKGLLKPQAYHVYDSRGLPAFGLTMRDRGCPNLPGPAYGQGAITEYGPKRIGPSFLHVRIHAGAGYNLGLSFRPFLLFGELFMGGGIQVKVFFFKFGLGLYALLRGRLTSEIFEFSGELAIEIGLPWPLPDVEVDVPFGFTIGSGLPIPTPAISTTISALRRAESVAISFDPAQVPVLPIDAVIALGFDKPMRNLLYDSGQDTRLLPTETITPDPAGLKESLETTVDGKTFTIEYVHDLAGVRIEHRSPSGGPAVQVAEMSSTWEAPVLYDGSGAPDADQEPHHALYLNTFLPPELNFFSERLGQLVEGRLASGYLPPCKTPGHICMMRGDAPAITEDAGGNRVASKPTTYGDIRVRESVVMTNASPLVAVNRSRLVWDAGGLRLPYEVAATVPAARRVTMRMRLITTVSSMIDTLVIGVDVRVTGQPDPVRLLLTFRPAQTPCRLDLATATIPSAVSGAKLGARVRNCQEPGVIDFVVVIETTDPALSVERFTVRGPIAVPRTFLYPGGAGGFGEWHEMSIDLKRRLKLILYDLCYVSTNGTRSAWKENRITRAPDGSPLTGEEAVEAFWMSHLFEPDRIYTITYQVNTTGRTYETTSDGGGGDLDHEKTFVTPSSDAQEAELRTVTFRTEAAPSQNISKYLGFAYPDAMMQPVYPAATVPLMSFRYAGLIKRIYRLHKGADVLRARVTDIDGNEIQSVLTTSLKLGSGASDEVLDELVAACLPEAQGYSRLQLDIFDRALLPDKPYALSVEDTSVTGPDVVPPVRIAFRTSRYADIVAHIAAVNQLVGQAAHVPLLDAANPSATLASVFQDLAGNLLTGFDDVIEELYRRGTGLETGRLAEALSGDGNVAAHLVVRGPDGSLVSYGIAIELAEPLLGKEGVSLLSLGVPTSLPGLEDKGVQAYRFGTSRHLVVRDRSGSRLLIFNSADAVTFDRVLAPMRVRFRFDGRAAVRHVVTRYVENTFNGLSAAEQTVKTNETMSTVAALPHVTPGLASGFGDLVIDPVVNP